MRSSLANDQHLLTRRGFFGVAGSAALGITAFALFGCSSNGSSSSEEDYLGLAVSDKGRADLDRQVDELLAGWSDHQKLCQLFVVTPETLTGIEDAVTQAGATTQSAIEAFPVAGIVYFEQNLIDEAQTTSLLKATFDYGMAANGIPPLLCVDEEGSTVVRIGGKSGFSVEDVGDMADVGATGDPARAREVAEYVGDYLKALGFNTNFAPVCDVANNPESDMRRRSFGSDPELVAQMIEAQIEGFNEIDLLCSAKHFPGIGSAVGDSHNERIYFNGTLEQLEAVELVPFKAAIKAGVPLVMVGHLSLPEIVGDEMPACLSSKIVTDLLRDQLGFQGIAVSDSLQMDAILDFYSTGEACVQALQAGCDLLLMPYDLQACLDAINAALEEGTLSWERIDESLRRILRIKLARLTDQS